MDDAGGGETGGYIHHHVKACNLLYRGNLRVTRLLVFSGRNFLFSWERFDPYQLIQRQIFDSHCRDVSAATAWAKRSYAISQLAFTALFIGSYLHKHHQLWLQHVVSVRISGILEPFVNTTHSLTSAKRFVMHGCCLGWLRYHLWTEVERLYPLLTFVAWQESNSSAHWWGKVLWVFASVCTNTLQSATVTPGSSGRVLSYVLLSCATREGQMSIMRRFHIG